MKQHNQLIYSNWHNNLPFTNRLSYKSRQITFKYSRFIYLICDYRLTYKYTILVNRNDKWSIYSSISAHNIISQKKFLPFVFLLHKNIKKWCISVQFQLNYFTLFSKQDSIWKSIWNKKIWVLLHDTFNYILFPIINFTKQFYKIRYSTLVIYSTHWLNQIYHILYLIFGVIPIILFSNKKYLKKTYVLDNNINFYNSVKNIKSIFQITSLLCVSILIYKFNTQNIFKNYTFNLPHLTSKYISSDLNNKFYSFDQNLLCNEKIFTNENQSRLQVFPFHLENKKINFSDLFISKLHHNIKRLDKAQSLPYLDNMKHIQINLNNKKYDDISKLEKIVFELSVFQNNLIHINDFLDNLKYKLDVNKYKFNFNVLNTNIVKNNNILIFIVNTINQIITKLYLFFTKITDHIQNNKYLLFMLFRIQNNNYINNYFKTPIFTIYNNEIHLKTRFNILSTNYKNIFSYKNISHLQKKNITKLIKDNLTLNISNITKSFPYSNIKYNDISYNKLILKINKLNNQLTRFENIQNKNQYNSNLLNMIDSQLYSFNNTKMIDTIQSFLKLVSTTEYNFFHHVLYTPKLNRNETSNKFLFKTKTETKFNEKLNQTLKKYLCSQINIIINYNKMTSNELYPNVFLSKENLYLLRYIKQIILEFKRCQYFNHIIHLSKYFYIQNQKWNQLSITIPKVFIKSNNIPLDARLLLQNSILKPLHYKNNLIWSFSSIYSTQNFYKSTGIVINNKIDHIKFYKPSETILFTNHFKWLYKVPFFFSQIYHLYLYRQTNVLKQYKPWFLTTKFWIFYHKIFETNILLIQQYSYDRIYNINYIVFNKFNNWSNKLNLLLNKLVTQSFLKDIKYYWINSLVLSKRELFDFQKQLRESIAYRNILWINNNNIQLDGIDWSIIIIIILGCSICIYNVSSFVIYNQFVLWQKFNYTCNLNNPSWILQFQILFFKNILSPLETTSFQTAYLLSKIMDIQHNFYSGWIGSKIIPKLTLKIQALDLSLKQQNVTIQSFLQLKFHHNKLHINRCVDNKLNYTQILKFQNISNPYSIYNIDIIYNSFKNVILASTLNCINLQSFPLKRKINLQPKLDQLIQKIQNNFTNVSTICLDLTDDKSDHILLVSSNKIDPTYFQYLIPHYFNIIQISAEKLICPSRQNLFDEIYIKESIKKIAIILKLSRRLRNCIIWIPDFHKFCSYSLHHQIDLISHFILSTLLKNIVKFHKFHISRKIYFIGSTNNVEQLESTLIYPKQFNSLIYIRTLDMFHRNQMLFTFLNNSKYKFKYNFNQLNQEIGNRTKGYDWNDLLGLANEMALVAITQNTYLINTNTLKFAMYKQISTINNIISVDTFQKSYNLIKTNFSNNLLKHFLLKQQVFYYKIGKAIVASIFKNPNWIIFFPIHNMMWKTRFYYLLQTYLELNTCDNTITIIAIMPIILNCLGGLAARDAWISFTNKFTNNGFILIHEIENDIKLASGLFGGLFSSICFCDIKYPQLQKSTKFIDSTKDHKNNILIDEYNLKCINNNNMLNVNKITLSYYHSNKLVNEKCLNNIQWGYRIKRFPICKNIFFNSIHTIQQYIWSSSSYNSDSQAFLDTESKNWFKDVPYRRNIIQKQPEMKMEIDKNKQLTHFNNLIGIDMNYHNFIEYTFIENSIILMLGKPILSQRNLILNNTISFWYRDLLITKDILTTLFIKYGQNKRYHNYLRSQMSWLNMKFNNKLLTNESKIVKYQQLLSEQTSFNIFQSMIKISTQMKRPQLCFPAYFYQRSIANNTYNNYNEWFILNESNTKIVREMFVSQTILESYNYLLRCFLSHFQFILNN